MRKGRGVSATLYTLDSMDELGKSSACVCNSRANIGIAGLSFPPPPFSSFQLHNYFLEGAMGETKLAHSALRKNRRDKKTE